MENTEVKKVTKIKKDKTKKEKNSSIFGVIAFLYKIMDKKERANFIFLTFANALNGFFKLLPTQIIAMLVSLIAGQDTYIFGLFISKNANVLVVIALGAISVLIPYIFNQILGYYKNKFALCILLKTKRVAYDWATTPRKNLNLGMTIGDATYRINDSIVDIEFVLNSFFDTIIPQICMAVLSFIFVCFMELWSIPVLVLGIVLSAVAFLVRSKVEIPVINDMEKHSARITNFMVNTLGNLTQINLSKSQSMENGNLKKRTDDYLKSSKKRFSIWEYYWIVNTIINVVCTYGIMAICAVRVRSGQIFASDIVIINNYVANVFNPIQNCGWFLNSSTQLMTKINRLKELRPTIKNSIDVTKDNYLKPIEKITLKNVSVINDDDTVIENINYTLNKGELTVVTGESGGGKTTSLRALLGIAERQSGDIIINDEYKAKSMYSFIDRFSVVMQSPFIFNRDVKDNVYYPNVEPTPRSKEIVKGLNMGKIINKKFDEDSEQEMQYKLSGGEKKRICVLRGLIQEKEVYVFDEPTNELDADNTNRVLDYINQLKTNAIVMVVTHDKRMIDKADKVVTINNNKVSSL
ncbi:MAG: ATP-binding cassette domain-containing protein [Christensenellales bacterium]